MKSRSILALTLLEKQDFALAWWTRAVPNTFGDYDRIVDTDDDD
jgi:hypothetical protein